MGGTYFAKAQSNSWATEDVNAVDRALAVLFVVGNASDAAAVEALLSHPGERIQKAARTCLFEIRQRRRDNHTLQWTGPALNVLVNCRAGQRGAGH
jgi:hypothetical protein